jgi:hypothetical protein
VRMFYFSVLVFLFCVPPSSARQGVLFQWTSCPPRLGVSKSLLPGSVVIYLSRFPVFVQPFVMRTVRLDWNFCARSAGIIVIVRMFKHESLSLRVLFPLAIVVVRIRDTVLNVFDQEYSIHQFVSARVCPIL